MLFVMICFKKTHLFKIRKLEDLLLVLFCCVENHPIDQNFQNIVLKTFMYSEIYKRFERFGFEFQYLQSYFLV